VKIKVANVPEKKMWETESLINMIKLLNNLDAKVDSEAKFNKITSDKVRDNIVSEYISLAKLLKKHLKNLVEEGSDPIEMAINNVLGKMEIIDGIISSINNESFRQSILVIGEGVVCSWEDCI